MKKAVKQVSQETFDEVVKENVEDFGMSPEEATRDAIAQFESQGVDLSNIIKRLGSSSGEGRDLDEEAAQSAEGKLQRLKDLIEELKASANGSSTSEEQAVEKLDAFADLLERVPEMKVIAGRNDAIDPLLRMLESSNQDIVGKTSALLAIMCSENEDNQDFVGAIGLEILATVLMAQSSKNPSSTQPRLINAVRVACAKHEANKSHFVRAKGIEAALAYLERAKTDDIVSKVLAGLLRVLTINDDPKAAFSQAQDTIKVLVARELIPYAIEMLQTHLKQPEVLSPWLAVLKQIAITEENCKKMHDLAGLDVLLQIMLQHERNLTVVKRCVNVFRNVAAADDLKEFIILSGGAEQIMSAMQTHSIDSSLQQHSCATLAVIALRSPENSTRIVDLGAARMIAFAMRIHKTDTLVLRQASLAIRNMVARAPELRARILDEDVEELLREAQKYRGCGDEAYAALRDLGCDIKLSSFGTATQPLAQFNPVNVINSFHQLARFKAAEAPFAHYS